MAQMRQKPGLFLSMSQLEGRYFFHGDPDAWQELEYQRIWFKQRHTTMRVQGRLEVLVSLTFTQNRITLIFPEGRVFSEFKTGNLRAGAKRTFLSSSSYLGVRLHV